MKTLRFMSFAAGLALLFVGCTGPAGPEGEPGADGNANVVGSSYAVPVWNVNATNYYINISDPNLTSAINNSGTTEVFLTIDAGNTFAALPFTYYGGLNPNYIWSYTTNVGLVNIYWTNEGSGVGSDPNTIYGQICNFKVVDIASSVMKRHPNTDWKNYSQVISVMNQENAQAALNNTPAPIHVQTQSIK